jgi:MerR family mercuric resistance operon transcriptional regulator
MPAITVSRDSTFTIGTLSERSGVNIETIRFYERVGILPKAPRSAGRQRIYDRDLLKRLIFVRRSRELGFSLEEIRDLLRLVDGRRYSCAEVKALTLGHLAEVQRTIADLGRLQRTLSRVAGMCRGGRVPDCPIIDALFDARRQRTHGTSEPDGCGSFAHFVAVGARHRREAGIAEIVAGIVGRRRGRAEARLVVSTIDPGGGQAEPPGRHMVVKQALRRVQNFGLAVALLGKAIQHELEIGRVRLV